MVWHASVGKLSSGRDGQETAEPKMKIQRKRDAEKNDRSRRTGGEVSQVSKSTEGSGDVGTYKVIQMTQIRGRCSLDETRIAKVCSILLQ